MTKQFVLDTNTAIAIMNGDAQIDRFLEGVLSVSFLPSSVLGELYYGAEKSGCVQENLKRVGEFAARRIILHCDQDTARHYGSIFAKLRKKRTTCATK